jgi:S1-C subfamily serine protease
VIAAGLAVAAIGAGAGIGHTVWTSSSTPAAASNSATTPGSSNGSFPYRGSGFGGYGSPLPSGNSGSSNTSPSTGSSGPSDASSIAAKVDPALVDINSSFGYQSTGGLGTGIVLTSTGEILTNNHVINGATSIQVTDVGNGKTYTATVVGYDKTHDIAVLQLQGASGLQTAQFANSASTVGEPVVAVGNAGGTGGTPTAAGGSITALNQSITAADQLDGTSEQLAGLIQVNADVQSGDSGGALVNSAGQIIGMDTAAAQGVSLTSSYQGYAVPIGQALTTASAIENGQGSSTIHVGATAFLGVLIDTTGTSGLSTQGAALSGVVGGGPAAQAGLGQGDVITSLNGQAIDSASALSDLMAAHHPGDRVQLGWTDSSGQSHSATVQLTSGPPA